MTPLLLSTNVIERVSKVVGEELFFYKRLIKMLTARLRYAKFVDNKQSIIV